MGLGGGRKKGAGDGVRAWYGGRGRFVTWGGGGGGGEEEERSRSLFFRLIILIEQREVRIKALLNVTNMKRRTDEGRSIAKFKLGEHRGQRHLVLCS